jgi:hypothetical protein
MGYGFYTNDINIGRKYRKNKCKKVYQNSQRCIETHNKVYQFVELIHFLTIFLVICTKKCNFALQIKT